jgi:predicted enzyme related to lactoylglutathione lyase
MEVKGIHLNWITVKNLEAAIKFYTEIAGLKLKEHHKEFGWAELAGPEGSILGIAQENSHDNIKAGTNAVITITVDDIQKARDTFKKKGARLVGDVIEVPGHVKMQTFLDTDGNMLQLAELLY